MRDVGVDIH
jgi:ATP-binding cassette, subfamily A (ABC1), member 3